MTSWPVPARGRLGAGRGGASFLRLVRPQWPIDQPTELQWLTGRQFEMGHHATAVPDARASQSGPHPNGATLFQYRELIRRSR
jgi:hypothetical protein